MTPHGYCFLWQPALVVLHTFSDALIGVSYFTIPVTIIFINLKQADKIFSRIFVLFALFITFCGVTHFFSIWNIWHTDYWIEGITKLATGIISFSTALILVQFSGTVNQLLKISSLMEKNTKLEKFINGINTLASNDIPVTDQVTDAALAAFCFDSESFLNDITILSGNNAVLTDYCFELMKVATMRSLDFPQEEIEAYKVEIDINFVEDDLVKLLKTNTKAIERLIDLSERIKSLPNSFPTNLLKKE